VGGLWDSTTRLVFPVDASLGPLILGATRSHLNLYRLPRAMSGFITARLEGAIKKLSRTRHPSALRASLLLQRRGRRIRVAIRISRAGTADLRLSPLTRGAPSPVRAEYRPRRDGGTLAFTLDQPVED
jgi:hypothetical protein